MQNAEVIKYLLSAPQGALLAAQSVYRSLEKHQLLAFDYDEKLRVIEPHAFGLTKDGNLALRAYQLSGESSRPLPTWAMYRLDKIVNPRVLETPSGAPRVNEGFVPNDRHLAHIFLEVAA